MELVFLDKIMGCLPIGIFLRNRGEQYDGTVIDIVSVKENRERVVILKLFYIQYNEKWYPFSSTL